MNSEKTGGRNVISSLRLDYVRFGGRPNSPRWKVLTACLGNPGLLSCAILRAQIKAVGHGRMKAASAWRAVNVALTGADFVPGCQVGAGLLIQHPNGIVIGHGAVIGDNCTILQQVTVGELRLDAAGDRRYPTIGDRVMLGAGARILGGIRVGHGAVIGANSVVLDDVPANATAVGIPARIVGLEGP